MGWGAWSMQGWLEGLVGGTGGGERDGDQGGGVADGLGDKGLGIFTVTASAFLIKT